MQTVEIRIEGQLDQNWSKWLDGFTLTHTDQGETILRGKIEDQADLYGLMTKLRDLGVTLISISLSKKIPGGDSIGDGD